MHQNILDCLLIFLLVMSKTLRMQLFQFSCHCVIVLSFSLPICLVLLERFNRGKHGLQRKARIFDNSWKAKSYRLFVFYRNNGLLTLQRNDDHEWRFVTLCGLFFLPTMPHKPIEREIQLGNKATLNQSDLVWMVFISYNACERCFCFLKAKQTRLPSLFNAVVLERIWLRILIINNKYSWEN